MVLQTDFFVKYWVLSSS